MRTLVAVLILTGFALAASPVLDTNVYKLSATKDGELSVYCANGGPTVVQIPGVGNVQFPDSMTPDQINEASHRLYTNAGAAAISANPPAVTKPSTDMEMSTLGNIYDRAQNGPKGPIQNPKLAMANAVAQGTSEDTTPNEIATGALAGGLQTVHTLARGVNALTGDKIAGLPTSLQQPAQLEPQGAAENVGYGLENILEFITLVRLLYSVVESPVWT